MDEEYVGRVLDQMADLINNGEIGVRDALLSAWLNSSVYVTNVIGLELENSSDVVVKEWGKKYLELARKSLETMKASASKTIDIGKAKDDVRH